MRPAIPRGRRSMLAISWRVGLFFLAFALFSAIFVVPVSSKLPEWEQRFPVRTLLYTGAAVAVTLLLATWVMTRFVDRRPFRTVGFSFGHALRDVAGR